MIFKSNCTLQRRKQQCLSAMAILLALCSPFAHSQTQPQIPTPVLQIAAAADLAACIDRLNEGFSRIVGGADVKSSITSSGNAVAQISNGAPFDLFLSADTGYPNALVKTGLADASTLTVYAFGRLAMLAANEKIDVGAGFALLTRPEIKRIAIANPEVAPYGRAAKAALQQAGVWDAIQPKLVFGDNVAQTVQFVRSGSVDLGFVGAAHLVPGQAVWILPQPAYPAIEQGGIVTAKGKANPLAPRYLRYLQSDDGRNRLRECGFNLPTLPANRMAP